MADDSKDRRMKMLEAVAAVCDRLSERTATLFLGAGVNAGVVDADGQEFPLGPQLSALICKDLLEAPDLQLPLVEAAEMAKTRFGDKALNDYLYSTLTRFRPGTAHLALVQLPWDMIYTTNYDLLVEAAAEAKSVVPAGTVRPVFSTHTDLSQYTEDDMLYYKLHGSVDFANKEDGQLIITREDYRYYQQHRQPLFSRLQRDLARRTFVFVGYSLRDDNFRYIIEDCRKTLGVLTFPRSYAVRPKYNPVLEPYWLEKFNIQFIDAEAAEFLVAVRETWASEQRKVVPFAERMAKHFVAADHDTAFEKVGESFYHIKPSACLGHSDAKRFFKGAEPSWADVRDRVPPYRDAYYVLLEAMIPELVRPEEKASVYLVTGAAGTGKTTLIRSLAFDLADQFTVLAHIPDTPFDASLIGSMVIEKEPKRIVILVEHAGDYVKALESFVEDIRLRKLPVTLLLEERKNQWIVATSSVRGKLAPEEFELGILSEGEITSILDALEKHGALEKLTGTDRAYQMEHFASLAEKDLLVALRELTTESSFDSIVRDEYLHIPSEVAKRAYLYVAAVGQVDLAVRYETLQRILDIGWSDLRRQVFEPAAGILISGEQTGMSRHNYGYRLRTRHPIIASVIFDLAAPDDQAKYEVLNKLIEGSDPGYAEDERFLWELVRHRELAKVFVSHEYARAIYSRLQDIFPDNPYVLQHRSIIERDLGDAAQAEQFARDAYKLNSQDPSIANTLGMALEFSARECDDPLKKKALLSEAARLFENGIKRKLEDPYGWMGMAQVLRHELDGVTGADRRAVVQAKILSLLQEADEATNSAPMIAGALARTWNELGSEEEAIRVLKVGLQRDPTDVRLYDLWIQIETNLGHTSDALDVATRAAKIDPNSWRLQRHIARLSRREAKPVDMVKGHYAAAIRNNRSDVGLRVEFGAYLFMNGLYDEARGAFSETRDMPISSAERSRVREQWRDENGNTVRFEGRIDSIRGALARVIAVPDNFRAQFFRAGELVSLKEGDSVGFSVVFNAHGATARILQ